MEKTPLQKGHINLLTCKEKKMIIVSLKDFIEATEKDEVIRSTQRSSAARCLGLSASGIHNMLRDGRYYVTFERDNKVYGECHMLYPKPKGRNANK